MMVYRNTYCGELTRLHQQQSVILSGWIERIREVGSGLTFILLRDRSGLIQLVIDATLHPQLHEKVPSLHHEDILRIEGQVLLRKEKDINPQMSTGEIEVTVHGLELLSSCPVLPFQVINSQEVDENLRLKHRYIDLRNPEVMKTFKLRHQITQATRNYFSNQGFWEIETPYLAKSTPEGARDFLVPSRVNPTHFYALTQSPQIYKQLLMMGGIDKYFQVCRCFRDEDFRLDRQPEFTQIDFECAFTSIDELKVLIEELMKDIFSNVLSLELKTPFTHLSYQEAMDTYGTDKPDLRNPLKIKNIASTFQKSSYAPFAEHLQSGKSFMAIALPGDHISLSRKQTEDLLENFRTDGVVLYLFKHKEQGIAVNILEAEDLNLLAKTLESKTGDSIIAALGSKGKVLNVLGRVRQHFSSCLLTTQKDKRYEFTWITEFPLFEWNEEENRYQSAHHLFTQPHMEDFNEYFPAVPEKIRAASFDLVLNGFELGSGGLRIHHPDLQRNILRFMGFNDSLIDEQFGFLIEAMRHGAPPEGGFAIGMDRLVMVLGQLSSLREAIAFPKNTRGASPLTGEPSKVSLRQLNDLHIQTTAKEEL